MAQSRWLLLAACLDRISINWFSRIRTHMLLQPEFWAGIENFPMELCACDNFRRQTIATVGSTAVAEVHKRAIAQGLLLFGEPGLVAQIAYLAKVCDRCLLPVPVFISNENTIPTKTIHSWFFKVRNPRQIRSVGSNK